MDVFSFAFLIVLIPTFHVIEVLGFGYGEILSTLVASETILLLFKYGYLAQFIRGPGMQVLMIRSIIADSLPFCFWAGYALCGFALGFMVVLRHPSSGEEQDPAVASAANASDASRDDGLQQESDLVKNSFGGLVRAIETLLYALTGTFDPEIYHVAGAQSSAVSWLFALFLISFPILLLNLLISIMGDTFDRVKGSEEARVIMNRARFIDAWEASLTYSQREEIDEGVQKYILAVVDPDNVDDEKPSEEWMGKLHAIDSGLRFHIQESEKTLRSELQELESRVMRTVRNDLQAQEERLAERTGRIESQIAAMNEDMQSRMDRLLHHLMGETSHSPVGQPDP